MEELKHPSKFDTDLEKQIELKEVQIEITPMVYIIKQASLSSDEKGWGKLLGYYDTETNSVCVKECYALPVKFEDRFKKEDNIEGMIRSNLREESQSYEIVGFYLISDENNFYTYSFLNYLLNNEAYSCVKLFLFYSTNHSKIGANPWRFYELSELLNKSVIVDPVSKNSHYELNMEMIKNFEPDKDDFFREVKFVVNPSPIWKYLVNDNIDELIKRSEDCKLNIDKTKDSVNEQLEDCIKQKLFNVNMMFMEKKSTYNQYYLNAYGSNLRKNDLMKLDKEISELEGALLKDMTPKSD